MSFINLFSKKTIDCHICKQLLNVMLSDQDSDYIVIRDNLKPTILLGDIKDENIIDNNNLTACYLCPICLEYIDISKKSFYITKCGHGICGDCKKQYIASKFIIPRSDRLDQLESNSSLVLNINNSWLDRILNNHINLKNHLRNHWSLNWFKNLSNKPRWLNEKCRLGSFNKTVIHLINRKIGIWIRFDNSWWKFIVINDWYSGGHIYRGLYAPPAPRLTTNYNLFPIWLKDDNCCFIGSWNYGENIHEDLL